MDELNNVVWHKSSYSGGASGNCVEVADAGEHVYVRNTRDKNGAVLEFSAAEWDAFLAGARDGEFDRGARLPACLTRCA
jgi:hypothetical protein